MSYVGSEDKDIQSPELWQLVLNNVDDLIAVVDLDGRRIYNSPSYKKLFSDIEELHGTDSFQEIHPDDRDRIRRLFSETVRTGIGQQAEFRFLLKDGTVRYIESHGNVIRDASGNLEKVVIISRDVTRHRLDREALQRSEQHFRAFFEHSSDIIVITDDKYTIVHGSPSIGRVLGYRPEEYLGRSLITLLHPDEVPKVVHTFLLAQETPGAVHPIEHRWQHRLGAWRMFESMCKAVANEHGERTIIINSRDITERNRAEEFLRETNYALQSLIRTSPLAIVATDLEDKVKIWNKAAEHIFGWSEREVLGGSLPIAPKDRTQHPQPLPAPDTTASTPAETELQIQRKDGSFVDISVWRTALRDANGVAVGTLALYADITERKQAKEALHESERKFKELVELLPQCVFESDYHGRISFANRYAFELFGYTQDEFHKDLNILQILAPCDHERANDNFQKVLDGEKASEAEYTLKRKDGSTFPGIIYSSPIVHHENTVGVRGIIVDITERKRAETTLREAESKFRHLVEQSLVGVYIIQDGKFSYVNPQLAEIFGYEQDEILKSKTVGDLVAEEDRALVGENIRRRIQKEIESVTYGFRGLKKNGSRIDVEVFGSQTEYNGKPAVIGTLLNITERKQAERQLKESEERFRALVEATSDWIWETDCNGVYTYASPKVLELLGYRSDEVIGKKPFDFMDPGEAGRVSALFAAARDKHALFHATENRNRHKDGHVVILETSAVPIIDPSGKLQGYRGIDRDVTQRRKAEEEIAQQKEYLQRILDSSLDLVLTIQSDGTVAYANDRLSETMGYTLTEIRGRHFMELVPESSRPALQKRWDELKQGIGGVYETQLQRADGGIVEFLVSNSQLKGSDEYLAVLKDITALKRAEEELGRQKSYFQQLFENSPEAIVILDNADRIISTNRSFAQLFQFSAEEARGSSLNDIIVPQHLLEEASSLSRNVLQGEVIHYETVRKRKDGTLVDVSILGAPIVSGENQIGVYGIYSDITNRKLAEKERARLNSAVEQAAEAIVITDIDATVLYVNPAFERITGYGRDEALGKNPRLLKSGKHGKEFYERMWSTLLKGDVWSGTITNKRKDGSLYEEEMVISPVRDESARIVNYVAVKRDVTHELEIERQLRQSQKMESLGQLASGIAHDFNNVLGVIGGSLTVLRTRISDAQLERYIDMGETAVSRGADVAKRLLTFSREEEIQLVPISLGSIVDELTKVLASVIEKTVTLSTDIPRDLPLVQGDHGQLYQVLLNLCINARDAILDPRSGKTGGTISIDAKTIAGSQLRERFHEASVDHYIRLSVCDNGTGMTEEVRQRIFDPFFTTKPRGKGTGLGLAVVYGIVKSHLGFIEVESQMGQGSTFHVYLPVHAYEAQITEQRKEETTTGGSETILVVEDETSLRTLLTELLQMHGYTVITATNGVEALETYTARQSVIAVVISDMGLPKLSGEELVMKIKELNQSARIIIASGYLEPHQRSKLLLAGVKAFVQKPYHGTSILKTMREVLDAKA